MMKFAITERLLQQIPPQGQQILAEVDCYLDQATAFGKTVSQVILADADFIYLVNRLQFNGQAVMSCNHIDYQGIKLVRYSEQATH